MIEIPLGFAIATAIVTLVHLYGRNSPTSVHTLDEEVGQKAMKTTSVLRARLKMLDEVHEQVQWHAQRGANSKVRFLVLEWYNRLSPKQKRDLFNIIPQPDDNTNSAFAAYKWVHCNDN